MDWQSQRAIENDLFTMWCEWRYGVFTMTEQSNFWMLVYWALRVADCIILIRTHGMIMVFLFQVFYFNFRMANQSMLRCWTFRSHATHHQSLIYATSSSAVLQGNLGKSITRNCWRFITKLWVASLEGKNSKGSLVCLAWINYSCYLY